MVRNDDGLSIGPTPSGSWTLQPINPGGPSFFFGRAELSDCSLRLPGNCVEQFRKLGVDIDSRASASDQSVDFVELPCHRFVLCTASRYFSQTFASDTAQSSSVTTPRLTLELPSLPLDAECRDHMDIAVTLPLALLYMYSGQSLDEIEDYLTRDHWPGLFLVALFLEMDRFIDATFHRMLAVGISEHDLPKILHCFFVLNPGGARNPSEEYIMKRLIREIKQNFDMAVQDCGESISNSALLAKLPVDILENMLRSTDLLVSSENVVLQFVLEVLANRLRREEIEVRISDAHFISDVEESDVGGCLSLLGCIWEGFVEQGDWFKHRGSTLSPMMRPRVSKYAWRSEPMRAEDVHEGRITLQPSNYQMRVPAAGFGSHVDSLILRVLPPPFVRTKKLSPRSLLKLEQEQTEATFWGVLLAPSEKVQDHSNAGANSAGKWTQRESAVWRQDGKQVGRLRYRWSLQPVFDPCQSPAASSDADCTRGYDMPLDVTDARKLLDTLRLSTIAQQDLIDIMEDPLLFEAGGDRLVLDALAAELRIGTSPEQLQPRKKPAPGTKKRQSSVQQNIDLNDTTFSHTPHHQPLSSERERSEHEEGQSREFTGKIGTTLFHCKCGGRVRVEFDNANGHWCVKCGKVPRSCNNNTLMPKWVEEASVDGRCAICTLRLEEDVHTITLRLGTGHPLMPLHGDVLFGLCVAGCNDFLNIIDTL